MVDNQAKLKAIFKSDSSGLLDGGAENSGGLSQDDRLEETFREINEFYSAMGREPKDGEMNEYQLYARLQGIRESDEKKRFLKHLDQHDLFGAVFPKTTSMAEVMESDTLGILTGDAEDIFTMKHVPKAQPDYVSNRKQCKDFEKYEPMFIKVQAQLKRGERILQQFDFQEAKLKEGSYYVLDGVLLYLEVMNIRSQAKTIDGKRFRKDGKTRCVFENGTESDMLSRSLAKQLRTGGRIVTEPNEKSADIINEEDEATGFVYILKSLSDRPEIKGQKNLHKVGFTSESVAERVKNASSEPSYLMAPVEIVDEISCFNFNPQTLEKMLHHFFGETRLQIDVFDKKGKRHAPQEWIIAPYAIIKKAIDIIVEDKALNYKYDSNAQMIVALKSE